MTPTDGDFIVRDATPLPKTIESIWADSTVTLARALEEFIDNSLDAEATEVTIEVGSGSVSVLDNGIGCGNMQAMVTLGDRQVNERKKIGRFGIGLKETSMRLGPMLEITSRHEGMRYKTTPDWQRMVALGNWNFNEHRPIPDPGASFTLIFIPKLRPDIRRPSKKALEELELTYSPALWGGKRILYNGSSFHATSFPKLTKTRKVSGEYEGRRWKLHAGIADGDLAPWRPGYTIAFRDRLVAMGSTGGTFDYHSRNFFGYIELFEKKDSTWMLNRHKRGMIGEEDFLESLYPSVEEILKEAQTASRDLKFEKLGDEVSTILTAAIASMAEGNRIREKRGKGDEEGASQPKNTGRQRENAANSDPRSPGSVRPPREGRGMKIIVNFDDFHDHRLGDVRVDRYKNTVTLNKLHPMLSADPSHEVVAMAAVTLFAVYSLTHTKNGQGDLSIANVNGQFLDRFSVISGDVLESHSRLAATEKD